MEEEEQDEEVEKQEGKMVIKKKTGIQSQHKNDYTSSCLLWHFSKLIIHRAFLPLLPHGQLLRLGKKRRQEMHSAVSASRHDTGFCLILTLPLLLHFHLLALLILLSSSLRPWIERLGTATTSFAYRRCRTRWSANRMRIGYNSSHQHVDVRRVETTFGAAEYLVRTKK